MNASIDLSISKAYDCTFEALFSSLNAKIGKISNDLAALPHNASISKYRSKISCLKTILEAINDTDPSRYFKILCDVSDHNVIASIIVSIQDASGKDVVSSVEKFTALETQSSQTIVPEIATAWVLEKIQSFGLWEAMAKKLRQSMEFRLRGAIRGAQESRIMGDALGFESVATDISETHRARFMKIFGGILSLEQIYIREPKRHEDKGRYSTVSVYFGGGKRGGRLLWEFGFSDHPKNAKQLDGKEDLRFVYVKDIPSELYESQMDEVVEKTIPIRSVSGVDEAIYSRLSEIRQKIKERIRE